MVATVIAPLDSATERVASAPTVITNSAGGSKGDEVSQRCWSLQPILASRFGIACAGGGNSLLHKSSLGVRVPGGWSIDASHVK